MEQKEKEKEVSSELESMEQIEIEVKDSSDTEKKEDIDGYLDFNLDTLDMTGVIEAFEESPELGEDFKSKNSSLEVKPIKDIKAKEVQKPQNTVSADQYKGIMTGAGKLYVSTFDIILKRVSSAISGNDANKYGLTDEEKKEYQEISNIYFDSLKVKLSPTLIFSVATFMLSLGSIVSAISDRTENKERDKKMRRAKLKMDSLVTEKTSVGTSDEEVIIEQLKNTEEFSKARRFFEFEKNLKYRFYPNERKWSPRNEADTASPVIVGLMKNGFTSKQICELMYGE